MMLKQSNRSKLLVIAVLIIGLFGILVINTDPVSAEKKDGLIAASENTAVEQYQLDDSSVSLMPSLLKLMAAMVLVIGLIYGVLYLLKKMMGNKYSGNGQGKVLEVLETTYLGPKKTVSLIRVGGKAVLIGSTDGSITALGELDENETKEVLAGIEVDEGSDPLQNIMKATSDKFKKFTMKNKDKSLVDSQV